MRKFEVKLEETLSKVYVIEAESESEAMEIVQKHYDNAEDDYILSADNWEKTEVFCKGA